MAPEAPGPPLFVIKGQNLVPTSLVNHPDVIDFDPHGPHITSSQFVGVRYVGSGIVVELPKPPPHNGLSPHNGGVTDLLKGFIGGRRLAQDRDVSLSSGDLKANSISVEASQQNKSDRSVNWTNGTWAAGDVPDNDARSHIDHSQSQDRKDERYGKERMFKSSFPSSDNGEDSDVHTWELVWKEGKASGSLRRLKIVTTYSGYHSIQCKIDDWASASHTSTAMNEAAKAALAACGGHLKENPMHQEADLDHSVPVRRSHHDEAVDHKDHDHVDFGVDQTSNGMEEEEENTLHVQYVIDMQSIHLEGKIHPRCDSKSSILKDGHIMAIAAVLPVRFRSYNWTLLYGTDRDGISLNTLYRKVHMNGPTIVVIRDIGHRVFGCYASEEWKVGARSYGTGECFVFQVVPDMKAYKWNRTNSMFLFSNHDVLTIGGGDHCSILLNSDLLTGYSGACETFGSPSLASAEEFDVSSVEVWGFQ